MYLKSKVFISENAFEMSTATLRYNNVLINTGHGCLKENKCLQQVVIFPAGGMPGKMYDVLQYVRFQGRNPSRSGSGPLCIIQDGISRDASNRIPKWPCILFWSREQRWNIMP